MEETKEVKPEPKIEKVDLVYIVNTKRMSLPKNLELKYSLRSAVKFFPNLGKVFFVGKYFPKWAKGVTHLKCEEMKEIGSRLVSKADCMSRKIETAVNSKKVSDRFLRMCDDYCFMKKTSIDWIESHPLARIDPSTPKGKKEARFYYGKVYLEVGYSVLHHNYLRKIKEETERGIDFEIHSPMLIEKEKALETLKLFGTKMTFCSAYGNQFVEKPIMDGMYGYEHRAQIRTRQSRRGVEEHIKGKRFLNWDDQAFRHIALTKYCENEFGEPCRFEV